MATDLERLLIRIEGDTAKLRSELNRGEAAVRTSSRRIQSEVNGIGSAFNGLRSVLAAVGAFSLGRSLITSISEIQQLDVRLRGLTGSAAAFAEAQAFLARAANDLSVDVNALTDGYTKLLPLVQSSLLSTQQARDILVGYAEVAAATGASTTQLSQSLFGLTQGLSSGVLRAEELNQVTEPLPGLLQRLDAAAGLAAGGFRKLVVDGKVTADMFRDTLLTALGTYTGASEQASGTLQATWTRLGNSWTQLVRLLEAPVSVTLGAVIDAATEALTFLEEQYARNTAAKIELELESLEARIRSTTAEIARLNEDNAAGNIVLPEQFEAQLARLEERLDRMVARRDELLGGGDGDGATLTSDSPAAPSSPPAETATATKERAAALAELVQRMRDELDVLRQGEADREVYKALLEAQAAAQRDYNAGLRASPLLTGEEAEAIREVVRAKQEQIDAEGRLKDATRERERQAEEAGREAERAAERAGEAWEDAGKRAGDSLADVLTGARDWEEAMLDAIRNVIQEWLRFQALQQGGGGGGLVGSLLGLAAGALGGGVASNTAGIGAPYTAGGFFTYGGPRAGGGPVAPGRAYLVGEEGPELYVPDSAGTIHANGAGGPSIVFNNAYDFRGADRSIIPRVQAMIDEGDRRTFAQVFAQIDRGGSLAKTAGRRGG